MVTIRSVRKQCRICGEDCSGKARVKDQYGHYYCRECARAAMTPDSPPIGSTHAHHTQSIDHHDLHADVINAIRGEEAAFALTDTTPPPIEIPDAPPDSRFDAEALLADDDDIIPLAPVDDIEDTQLKTCPVCFHRYPPDTGICASCGFDEAKGIQSSRFVETSRAPTTHHSHAPKYACPHCNYDMSGCVSLTCPECGKVRPTRAKMDRERISRETEREAYRTPAIQLGVALGITLILGAIAFGWPALVVYPIVLATQSIIGLFAFYACCFLWIGFDAPMRLNLLRLASIYAVVAAADAFFVLVPVPFIAWIVPIILFVSLFIQQMEVDAVDAVAVLILTWIIGFGVALILLPALFAALGITL